MLVNILHNFEALKRAQKFDRLRTVDAEAKAAFDKYLANPDINMSGSNGAKFQALFAEINELFDATLWGDSAKSGFALRQIRKIAQEYAI